MEIKTFNVGNLRVTIHHDDNAESPRTMHDNAGIMACAHRRYDLGEDKLDTRRFDGWGEVEQHLMAEHNPIVIMPLYLMDHSGLSISTEPFGSRWDSGQVGFIYMTPERFKQWWGKAGEAMTEEQRIEAATKCLLAEVAEYDAYLSGEVYGYTIEAPKPCGSCGHTEWDEVGSGWGFVGGLADVEETARAEALGHPRHVAQKAAQTAQEAV